MIRTEGALGFWLDWVEHSGGLWEDDGERAFAVLPEQLAQEFGLSEETAVAADPDVAREEGALLLITGHPLIARAAESLLTAGDTGAVTLSAPRSVPPGAELLLAKARDTFGVDHGRIDAQPDNLPYRALRQVLRVGALVGYEFSADDHFQEHAETHVDLETCRPVPERTAARLARTERGSGDGQEPEPRALHAALARAHQQIDELATARREVLVAQSGNLLGQETGRAEEYYAAALDSIERRARTAPEDRRLLLEARARSTREEKARRLAEIKEKFRARHEITPYRLHLIDIPVLRLEVDVRRGARRYPMTLDWLLPVGEFAQVLCPACGVHGPALVATKTHLGCEACVPGGRKPAVPAARSAAEPSALTSQVPGPAAAEQSATKPAVARLVADKPATAEATSAKPAAARPRQATPARKTPATPARGGKGGTALKGDAPARAGRKPPPRSGDDRALAFWRHAAQGELAPLRKLCAPHSPAATLLRIYGAKGPACAVGVGTGETVESLTTRTYPGQPECTGGEVSTAKDRYNYLLCWSGDESGQATEVLPYASPMQWNMTTLIGRTNDTVPPRIASAPKPALGSDPVARALWTQMLQRRGMSPTLRALTAWWRLPDPAALISRYPTRTLAAATERAVCYWARMDGGNFTDTARQWAVDEAELRKAGAHLQRLLKLSSDTRW